MYDLVLCACVCSISWCRGQRAGRRKSQRSLTWGRCSTDPRSASRLRPGSSLCSHQHHSRRPYKRSKCPTLLLSRFLFTLSSCPILFSFSSKLNYYLSFKFGFQTHFEFAFFAYALIWIWLNLGLEFVENLKQDFEIRVLQSYIFENVYISMKWSFVWFWDFRFEIFSFEFSFKLIFFILST